MRQTASFAIAGLVLSASPVLADENSGLYAGIGLGDFSSEFSDVEDVDIDFDDDNDASKLFGGWRFNRLFALQVDYIDFGESEIVTDVLRLESDTRGLAPQLVATLPLGPVELFAKGGMLFYDIEVDLDGDELIDDSGEEVIYGGGIGLTLLERLALRAEYEVIEIDELEDAEAVWISAAWRF